MNNVQYYGRVNGISRIGDLLRQYAFPWLTFYVATGTPAQKVFLVTVASLIQAIPSLTLSHIAAKVVRRYTPLRTSIWANTGMGLLSTSAAIFVLASVDSKALVLFLWFLLGFMEVLYYPARDCLYGVLADGSDGDREQANRSSSTIYHFGRALISLAMILVVWWLGPVEGDTPRAAISIALFIDAITFAIVVTFLVSMRHATSRKAQTELPEQQPSRLALSEAAKVTGAFPVFLCILMAWAFAYSSFYFIFGFYKELKGVGESERQLAFYVAMFASACGGFYGAKAWKLSFHQLVAGMVSVCFIEALIAFVPTNYFWGVVWIAVNSAVSIMVYTVVFDGIIPQVVQGLDKNAEVSASLNLVKEGLSPVIVLGIAALASQLNAPRQVLIGACTLALLVTVTVLFLKRSAIESVIEASKAH